MILYFIIVSCLCKDIINCILVKVVVAERWMLTFETVRKCSDLYLEPFRRSFGVNFGLCWYGKYSIRGRKVYTPSNARASLTTSGRRYNLTHFKELQKVQGGGKKAPRYRIYWPTTVISSGVSSTIILYWNSVGEIS